MVYVLAMLRLLPPTLTRTPDRCSSAADVAPGVAPAEARQDLVADGAGAAADLVDGELAADERHEVAARDGGRRLGDVDDEHVHRHTPRERAAQADDDRLAG